MTDQFERTPGVLGGKLHFKGLRLPVALVLELIEQGLTDASIRADYYPELTDDHLVAARRFHAALERGEERSAG